MKFIYAVLLIFGSTLSSMAQKPSISDTSYKSWRKVLMSVLSPNGKYASFIENKISGLGREIIISATDKSWQKKFQGRQSPIFSKNGKDAYILIDDNLLRIELSSDRIDTLAKCNEFELAVINRKEYLIYITKSDSLVITFADNKKRYRFSNVKGYWKSAASEQLLFAQTNKEDNMDCLTSLYLKDGTQKKVYCGAPPKDVIFDGSGQSVAFITETEGQKTLWNFHKSMSRAKLIISDINLKNDLKICIRDVYQFSSDAKRLIFSLEENKSIYRSKNEPDLWSYQDEILYARFKLSNYQTPMIERFAENLCSVDLSTGELTVLANPGENAVRSAQKIQDLVVLETITQQTPNKVAKHYTVLDLSSNIRTDLQGCFTKGIRSLYYSPDQRWLLYYDSDAEQWKCYDRNTKLDRSFASSIMEVLHPYNIARRGLLLGNLEILGWIAGTDRIIMQGTYDLWEVSLANRNKPLNLTGDGRTMRKIYSVLEKPTKNIFRTDDEIYLFSQNMVDKANSIYKLNLRSRELKILRTGNFFWSEFYDTVPNTYFQKAEEQNAFLFMEPNVHQTPNFKFTKDFKSVIELSNCHPENKVNWLTSELLNYKDSAGNSCQAVLYKPENFNPNKKYPVIFTIYAGQSQFLNQHISPELASSGINIPYMVSNGYLVCKPDMYLEKGKIADYSILSINAVADYLSKMNWVDSTKFGIVGHSFGGWEVNHILTRSHRFAAALTGAGPSSLINAYNDLWDDSGYDKHGIVLDGSFWMGSPLQDATEAYIENTPILYAKNISTPLLILHNEKDAYSQFYHSVHLFTFLKSMGKPAWLLSYPGEGHLIHEEANQFDFQYKGTSFFNYYLKGHPKPDWMSKYIKH